MNFFFKIFFDRVAKMLDERNQKKVLTVPLISYYCTP